MRNDQYVEIIERINKGEYVNSSEIKNLKRLMEQNKSVYNQCKAAADLKNLKK